MCVTSTETDLCKDARGSSIFTFFLPTCPLRTVLLENFHPKMYHQTTAAEEITTHDQGSVHVHNRTTSTTKTFNIADTPMMPMGGFAAAPPPKEEEEEAVVEVKEEQTEFTVKLVKFDDASKVKLIKEIKTFKEGMNLVQAKKFVEATTTGPQVVKEGIAKDEAEAIKAALEPLGAVVQID
ncbi:Ribosomal protein [Branchiostoma belcheri]|nr:Ribosomal protein [Branchiostoma belcheri]